MYVVMDGILRLRSPTFRSCTVLTSNHDHHHDDSTTVHQSSFKTSVQALMLLHQVVAGQGPSSSTKPNQQLGKGDGATRAGLEARFYRALYDKLKAPEVNKT